MKKIFFISSIFFVFLFFSTTFAGNILPHDQWEKRAQTGDVYYQALTAAGYYYGWPLKKDLEKAEKWIVQSVQAGHPMGIFLMAASYDSILGYQRIQDKEKGQELKRKVFPELKSMAQKGDMFAQEWIARMYFYGYGIPKDAAKAFGWYKKSSGQGNAMAMLGLGFQYFQGKGVKKDCVKAIALFEKGRDLGVGACYFNMGIITAKGMCGVNKNTAIAFEMYEKGAELKNGLALNQLGNIYRFGSFGQEKNIQKASMYYKEAASFGHAKALTNLGTLYYRSKEFEKAVQYYIKGGKVGESDSFSGLSDLYTHSLDAKGVSYPFSNFYSKIVEWEERALKADNYFLHNKESAKNTIALIYKNNGFGLIRKLKREGRELISLELSVDIEKKMVKTLKAYDAGMDKMANSLMRKIISTHAENLYFQCYESNFYGILNDRPLIVVSEWMMKLLPQKQNDPAFWIDYANSANQAGQPEIALKAVEKIKRLKNNIEDQDMRERVGELVIIITGTAMVHQGQLDKAYEMIFSEWSSEPAKPIVISFIINNARPLLKNLDKLSAALGVDKKSFMYGKKDNMKPHFFRMADKQAFYDIETGRLTSGTNKRNEKAKKEKSNSGAVILE